VPYVFKYPDSTDY